MKYLIILILAFLVFVLVNRLTIDRQNSRKLPSAAEKLKDLGIRFHLAIGAAAILIVIYLVVTLLVKTIN